MTETWQWAVGLSVGALGAVALSALAASLRSDLSKLQRSMRPLRAPGLDQERRISPLRPRADSE
ncbi:MAG: hypothetical protein ACP5P1_05365 [Acidimicrobiales bacterium]